jgi:hypothetical protein
MEAGPSCPVPGPFLPAKTIPYLILSACGPGWMNTWRWLIWFGSFPCPVVWKDAAMNTPASILPQFQLTPFPAWEQFSQEQKNELTQALAALLLHLPQLQALLEGMLAPGANDELQQ